MEVVKTIVDNLRECLRKALIDKRISKYRAAKDMTMGYNTIQDFLGNKRPMSHATLVKLESYIRRLENKDI